MIINLFNFIKVYNSTIKDMEVVFEQLYKEEFLSLQNLEEKIDIYCNIPSHFLYDYDDMTGLEAIINQDNEIFVLPLGSYLYDLYEVRNYRADGLSMLEHFQELLDDINNNKPLSYIYLYSNLQKERIKVYITKDVIMQWINNIFEYRVGSITLDW